jgi:hypothetical protein
MSTTTATKSVGQALLAHTQQASAAVTVGSAIDVSTKFGIRVAVMVGRTVATALTNELAFRLEGSTASSGNDNWQPIYQWTTVKGKTTAISTTLNGATTAGNTTSVLTSGTSFAAGCDVYFRETGTPANSEWSRMVSLSTNTITLEEAQTRNHTNGIAVTTLAERFGFDIDVSNIARVRLVVDSASSGTGAAAATGQTVDVVATYSSLDSATTV